MGLAVELEHGSQDSITDVTHDDEIITGKIAHAHLREISDYYTRLAAMEQDANGQALQRSPEMSGPQFWEHPSVRGRGDF